MRLNHLYSRGMLLEDRINPVEPQRLPPISEYRQALPFKPAIGSEDILNELDQKALPQENPKLLEMPVSEQLRLAREAYEATKNEHGKNLISGLNKASYAHTAKLAEDHPNDYIVLVADLDNTKWLNDESGITHQGVNNVLQAVGQLIQDNFPEDTCLIFHPHGDEFRIYSSIKDLDPQAASQQLVELIESALRTTNQLSSIGWVHGDPTAEMPGAQATISFGVSNGVDPADVLLTRAKTDGAKYSVTVDSDLLNRLQTKQHCPQDLYRLIQSSGAIVEQSQKAIQMLKDRRGAMLLECSHSSIPQADKLELKNIRAAKREYLAHPSGVMAVQTSPGMFEYLPLKEQYK